MRQKLLITTWQIFWKLTILSEIPKEQRKRERRFYLKCECGQHVKADLNHLKAWRIISCWCEHKKILSKLKTIHGQTTTKLYKTWCQIKTRCTNPKATGYNRYWWIWIKMHESWINNFEQFKNDIPEYIKWLSIDRIDNNKWYEPWNIKWSTNIEQQNNKWNTVWIETWKWKESLANLCRQYQWSYNTIYHYKHWNKSDHQVMLKLKSVHYKRNGL